MRRALAAATMILGACVSTARVLPDEDAGTSGDAAVDAPADASRDAGVDAAAEMVRIPAGGPFVIQGNVQATLTHAFAVDREEVTVARFRAWHAAGRPAPCAADCDLEASGPYAGRMRWTPAWSSLLNVDAYANVSSCSAARGTTVNTPTFSIANGDALPVTCVTWYQAVAFCAFDGGKRLLTETEWEYVANGRGEGRAYPWGAAPPTDCTRAIWFDNDVTAHNGCGWPKPAGTAAAGASRDGVLDLAGSAFEWVWDWQGAIASPIADYAGPEAGTARGTRGGSFASDRDNNSHLYIANTTRDATDPNGTYADIGFRCAKSVP